MSSVIFGKKKPLIGMVHLPPSVTYEEYPGKDVIIKKALSDLSALEKAGFAAALIENDKDQPHKIDVPQEIANEFAFIVSEVKKRSHIPLGIELLYDMEKTIRIAHKTNVDFVRLDVFNDTVETKWGIIHENAKTLFQLKEKLNPNLLIFVDIQVKHAKMVTAKKISESVQESIHQGCDAVIVTGELTGIPPSQEKCKEVKKAAGITPVLIGSGLDSENASEIFPICDGAIVGSSIKTNGAIDIEKAKKLAEKIGGLS